jgi:homoserine O-succinyltransferase/O-acetyltransferase
MPIKIPEALPAKEILLGENIFVMDENRALSQDIRAIRIAILNLMPTKIATETQVIRLLGNTPLQVEISLMRMDSHESKNTSEQHLQAFYQSFGEMKSNKYDGLIITGAPVEHLPFEEVDYWQELQSVIEWSRNNVYSTLFVCWGAQAALYHQFGIKKYPLPSKMFGVFEHTFTRPNVPLLRGFDDVFFAPHSRHTEIRSGDIQQVPQLEILSESEQAGVYIAARRDGRQIFVTGHSEYDPFTLKAEYDRDAALGLPIQVPVNYYPNDDPSRSPLVRWRGHSSLLFSNWLNYYVYQATPYDLEEINYVNGK